MTATPLRYLRLLQASARLNEAVPTDIADCYEDLLDAYEPFAGKSRREIEAMDARDLGTAIERILADFAPRGIVDEAREIVDGLPDAEK